jgi:hypothetical protein
MPHSLKTWDHHKSDTAYARLNKSVAMKITRRVGTVTAAYLFTLLALIALPSAIKAGPYYIVVWLSSSFLQLVLLPILLVGQNLQAEASDSRAEKTLADTEIILTAVSRIESKLDSKAGQ